MLFSQLPFLGLVESVPASADAPLVAALLRIAPVVIPSSLLAKTLSFFASLGQSAEYYVLVDDEHRTVDAIIALLDSGASKVVSRSAALVGQIPSDRLVLRLSSADTSALDDSSVLNGVSGIILDAASLLEKPLLGVRAQLQRAEGKAKDLFVLAATKDAIVHQPAALKLMSKSVAGTSVVPLSLLSLVAGNPSSPQPEQGKLSLTSLFTSALRTDRLDGLYTTIPVSLASVPAPLGVVYSSAASIAASIVSGNAVYFSRSRNGLWRKGETSGAMQKVERIRMDCDTDALEFGVVETGPNGAKDGFCHIPDQVSCFGGSTGLVELEATLKSRMQAAPAGSYTARLFSEPALLKAKIMEEAGELCDAVSKEDIVAEAADVLYFALAKCVAAGVGLKEIGALLDQRSLKITRRKGDAKPAIAKQMGLSTAQAVGVAGGAPVVAAVVAPAPEEDENAQLRCQIIDLAEVTPARRAQLHKRPVRDSADINSLVKPIIDTVRTGGDAGLRSVVVKFDRCVAATDPAFPLVLNAPFAPELMVLSPKVKGAIDQAYSNIKAFHQAQMDKESTTLVVETMPGVVCSRFARAIDRVGLYVPGGTAVLPSTALMLATPAQVAKCPLIVLSTPPRADGTVSPEIVYIASLTGVHHIVRAGGAQAVAAMAYGTETVPKVDKIFGPGNQFVTGAKMAVSMDSNASTAIDMPAGPSEVLVICDATSNPTFVASDLLSQAEHGADSQVVLLAIDLNAEQLQAIESELWYQALQLTRLAIVRKSIAHSLIIKCKDLPEAMEFSNSYAPEHLILHVHKANTIIPMVRNAGSIFVGPWSPESCGDYASGTNHTLPTYGYAKQYSGVSTLSFLKHITSQELTEDGLRALGPVVEILADAEGLDAHRNAVSLRLKHLESPEESMSRVTKEFATVF